MFFELRLKGSTGHFPDLTFYHSDRGLARTINNVHLNAHQKGFWSPKLLRNHFFPALDKLNERSRPPLAYLKLHTDQKTSEPVSQNPSSIPRTPRQQNFPLLVTDGQYVGGNKLSTLLNVDAASSMQNQQRIADHKFSLRVNFHDTDEADDHEHVKEHATFDDDEYNDYLNDTLDYLEGLDLTRYRRSRVPNVLNDNNSPDGSFLDDYDDDMIDRFTPDDIDIHSAISGPDNGLNKSEKTSKFNTEETVGIFDEISNDFLEADTATVARGSNSQSKEIDEDTVLTEKHIAAVTIPPNYAATEGHLNTKGKKIIAAEGTGVSTERWIRSTETLDQTVPLYDHMMRVEHPHYELKQTTDINAME
ncbi:unnamed protein product [Soboliphyme baturini]|uniref:Anaphase-promoting complex subunit 13 n=1 Tax=Soboliphyme baturini TaxID=241478 RepID=A0A183ISE8_9BILA|nr:unnamed protein product [Soboliphyme baturini]